MNGSKLVRSAAYAGASLVTLFSAGLVKAQDAAASAEAVSAARADDGPALEEIVVTAERRSGTASRIGMSIAAIGGEDLEKLRVQSADDVVKLVPGLSVAPSAYGTPIFNIRGLSFDTYNMSSTSPVGIYVDQVSYAYPIMASGGVFDVSRVEVLKGPQGTLYGRNTTGGLVNFISNQPTDTLEGSITLEAGNYETANSRGFVSGPLGSTVKARLAWQVNTSNKGWQESMTRPDDRLGEVEKEALRAIVEWQPTDAVTSNFSVNYWHDGSEPQAPQAAYYTPLYDAFGLPPATANQFLLTHGAENSQADWAPRSYQPSPNTSSPRPAYERHNEFFSVVENLEFQLNDTLTLYSLTAYNHFDRNETQNNDGTAFETQSATLTGQIKSFSQELRLAGEGDSYNWTTGAYYSRDKIDDVITGYTGDFSTVGVLRFVAGTLNDPRYTPTQIAEGFRQYDTVGQFDNRSASVFANGQLNLTDTVKASGGVRYTKDRSNFGGCAQDREGNTIPVWNTAVAATAGAYPAYNVQPGECMTFQADAPLPAGLVKRRLSEDNVSWRASIDWTPVDSTLLYGAIARGYKSGAFPVIGASTAVQYEPAKQEQVTSYEAGVKTSLSSTRLTFAGYYNDYQDKQVFGAIADQIFGSLSRLVNVPESETYGAEATVDWVIARGLTARASAAYTRTKVIEYTGFDPFGVVRDFEGSEFPNTPKWQLSGNIGYETGISQTLNIELLLDASYQSRSHGDFLDTSSYETYATVGSTERTVVNAPLFEIPSYTLVNGSVSLVDAGNRWRATLWVRNLADKDYWRIVAPFPADMVLRYAGMPRTYGASVTYNFGGN